MNEQEVDESLIKVKDFRIAELEAFIKLRDQRIAGLTKHVAKLEQGYIAPLMQARIFDATKELESRVIDNMGRPLTDSAATFMLTGVLTTAAWKLVKRK